jgi:hypothetical protein
MLGEVLEMADFCGFLGRFQTGFPYRADFVAKADFRPFTGLSEPIAGLNETGDSFGDLEKGDAREDATDIR